MELRVFQCDDLTILNELYFIVSARNEAVSACCSRSHSQTLNIKLRLLRLCLARRDILIFIHNRTRRLRRTHYR